MDFEAAIAHGGVTFDADYLNWGVGNGWAWIAGGGVTATPTTQRERRSVKTTFAR